ncbi:MAG: peptidylprolyl isomerase [Planctomycetota bacterium]|jgi:parvulin-like peptidyl-prolyl isomerase
MRRLALFALFVLLVACQDEPFKDVAEPTPPAKPATRAPDRITYDHILITFKGSYRRVESFRSQEEARRLAYRILDRVRSGVDFSALKEEYSDDRNPQSGEALGPYFAVNDGVRRKRLDEIPRRNFHPLLGRIIFKLKVHEVEMADWHAKDCPDGWHIVKRLE